MRRRVSDVPDVCLSFGEDDAALATAIQDRLEAEGLSVFPLDQSLTREDFASDMRQTILDSRSVVFLVSKSNATEAGLLFHAGTAYGSRRPILVVLSSIDRSEIPVMLQRFKAFKLWDGFEKLVAAVKKTPEAVAV